MKIGLLALTMISATMVRAEDGPASAAPLTVTHFGYAFETPDILLRQRIFGLAHGVHLLLSACLDKDENAAAAQQAYEAWHARQRGTLDAVSGRLAEYHFGAQASRAYWQDVAQALGLKETIYPSLGAVSLREACATLPQALAQDRYDFATQLGIAHDAAAR